MKKYRSLFAVILILFLRIGDINAAMISLEPNMSDVHVGEVFNIDLKISNVDTDILTTFDFNVLFEASTLEFMNFTFGDPVFGNQLDLFGFSGGLFSNVTQPSTGTINLTDTSFDTDFDLFALQLDEFIIGTFTFNAKAVGTSTLSFDNVLLGGAFDRNFIPSPLAFTAIPSSVDVTSTQVPEPHLASMLLFGLGIIGLRKRYIKLKI
ncbi:PEP-CTERM sorting domain-containing protein [Colwellia sp. UCD-KL20]|uniref:PEP-CTERM sorting domain-containing protein n=1 Tax=Colwellia sp. UCD-KL20 TaxID=1917165 RepID=UPI0009714CC4|nr:PEP-CTERM sorting domain-containing protein [Colwellia sp. UCD-KL20]